MDTSHKTHFHPNQPQLHANEHGFPFFRTGLMYGLAGAAIMGVYLMILNGASEDPSTFAKFIKHLVMIPVVGMAISAYKKALPEGKIFKDGLKLGLIIGIVAAIAISILNMILYMVAPDLAYEQFMNENNDLGSTFINSSFLSVEVFVFTAIITFCWLQFKKDGKPADG